MPISSNRGPVSYNDCRSFVVLQSVDAVLISAAVGNRLLFLSSFPSHFSLRGGDDGDMTVEGVGAGSLCQTPEHPFYKPLRRLLADVGITCSVSTACGSAYSS